MVTLSIYGSHHAALAAVREGRYVIVELEKFLNKKNSGLTNFLPVPEPDTTAVAIYKYLGELLDFDGPPDACTYGDLGPSAPFLIGQKIAAKCNAYVSHHLAHAANSFVQSPYEQSLIVTCDSGGDDGTLIVQLAMRTAGFKIIKKIPINLGYTYSMIGSFIKCVKRAESLKEANLNYAPKVMELSAYGSPRSNWLTTFEKLFRGFPLSDPPPPHYLPMAPYHKEDLKKVTAELSTILDLPLHEGIDGIAAYDLAATAQRAFENIFIEAITPAINQYPGYPICMGGGCAQNVYLNSRVREHFKREVFVPANSNNSGIALGMVALVTKPQSETDFSYVSFPLLGSERLKTEKDNRPNTEATPRKVAQLLGEGKVVGVAREGGDHGSYSLGNRTIFCDPATPNIATFLREAVKATETFIPFGAMVRADNADLYFSKGCTTKYPNFAVKVNEAYLDKFSSITHIDGTARVQAVTKEQNPWLYDLLGWFESYSGHGVLLSTSLNHPNSVVVSSVSDAFEFFDNTLLEALVVEDALFMRVSGYA